MSCFTISYWIFWIAGFVYTVMLKVKAIHTALMSNKLCEIRLLKYECFRINFPSNLF